jgi:hypothetical protein
MRLVELFEGIGERLWMPYQFAAEFQRNRAKAIIEQVESYRTIAAQFKKMVDQNLKPKHRHPFISAKSMAALELIRRELEKGRTQHEAMLADDPMFDRMTVLLTGRVGAPPTSPELDTLFAEATRRYGLKIPPGYADIDKPEPDRFGDYVGWKQILDYGAGQQCSLVLITDDLKEDWWYVRGDRTIGPRPELIAEYRDVCKKPFYMYTLEHFIRFAQGRFGKRVGQSVLVEIRQRSEERVGTLAAKPLEATLGERLRLTESLKPDIEEKSDEIDGTAKASSITDEPKAEQ